MERARAECIEGSGVLWGARCNAGCVWGCAGVWLIIVPVTCPAAASAPTRTACRTRPTLQVRCRAREGGGFGRDMFVRMGFKHVHIHPNGFFCTLASYQATATHTVSANTSSLPPRTSLSPSLCPPSHGQ